MNEFDLFRQWRDDRYGYASQQEFSEVDQFEAWQARADIELKRINTLEVLVEVAYREGFIDGYDDDARPQDVSFGWESSTAKRELEQSDE